MNAIILAAGMGTRLRPLTDDKPKPLVEIGGESFFSRQLRQLREAGIGRVSVVTGYRAEAFAPWRGRDGLEFIHNDRYAERNNLWSMFLARGRLGDSLVLDGDIWLADGVLPRSAPPRSCWFVGFRENMRDEWIVREGEGDGADDRKVERIDIASGAGWILTGLSYWTKSDGALLARLIGDAAVDPDSTGLFWDEIPRMNLGVFDVRARRIGERDWAEIDTIADMAELEASLATSRDATRGSLDATRGSLDADAARP